MRIAARVTSGDAEGPVPNASSRAQTGRIEMALYRRCFTGDLEDCVASEEEG